MKPPPTETEQDSNLGHWIDEEFTVPDQFLRNPSGSNAAEPQHDNPNVRVDKIIAAVLSAVTRSMIGSEAARIFVNGKAVKKSRPVRPGDRVRFLCPLPADETLIPEQLPLAILYEDPRVLVINKEQGMVVHPAAGNWTGTLAHALAYRIGSAPSSTHSTRAGIVHRLDKETSGVIITALDSGTHEFLAAQFKERETEKIYLAIVKGILHPGSGTVSRRIVRDKLNRKLFTVTDDTKAGRDAVTDFTVLRSFTNGTGRYAHAGRNDHACSLVRLIPKTGRTHQLRVHMRSIGHPILGDPLYSRKDPCFPDSGLMLHAFSLKIRIPDDAHPDSGIRMTFRAPLPLRFRQLLRKLTPLDGGAASALR